MLIMPAIDLKDGACVRLLRGRFDAVTDYGDPFEQLQLFAKSGAEWVHIVDLDGARTGAPAQYALIAELAGGAGLKIQCGGGVREHIHVAQLLEHGADRVVIGSASVKQPDQVAGWIAEYGLDRICIALDVRAQGDDWEVVINGWAAGAGKSIGEALAAFAPGALRHVLVTDISRDGAMTGPNTALIADLCRRRPDLQFQASGGVSQLSDLAALRAAGAGACIIGRALYERRFTLEDALAL